METKRSSTADQAEEAQEESAESVEQEDAPEPDSETKGLSGDIQKQFDELEEFVQDNPLAALGIAAGIGLVAGLLLSRR